MDGKHQKPVPTRQRIVAWATSLYAAASALIDQHILLANGVVFTFFGGCAFACGLTAWSGAGDMFVVVPALVLGWILASIAWAHAPGLSRRAKKIWIILTATAFLVEGYAQHAHFSHALPNPALPLTSDSNDQTHVMQADEIRKDTAHYRFLNDFKNFDYQLSSESFKKEFMGQHYVATYDARLNANSKLQTKFLSVYIAGYLLPGEFEDLGDYILRNYRRIMLGSGSNPSPVGEIEVYQASKVIYIYYESDVPPNTATALRNAFYNQEKLALVFRGPKGIDY